MIDFATVPITKGYVIQMTLPGQGEGANSKKQIRGMTEHGGQCSFLRDGVPRDEAFSVLFLKQPIPRSHRGAVIEQSLTKSNRNSYLTFNQASDYKPLVSALNLKCELFSCAVTENLSSF